MRQVKYRAYSKWYMRAFGALLPSGNQSSFPHIRKHLAERKVEFVEIGLRSGGRYFLFPETELRKLPHEKRQAFLPSNEDGTVGHSIYQVTPFQMAGLVGVK